LPRAHRLPFAGITLQRNPSPSGTKQESGNHILKNFD